MKRYFPILEWAPAYSRATFAADLIAALIVTVMLIPQSLAYALLAGLPAEVGLYASIAPLVLYALFGTSRTLAVGPVAVASLMTAAAVGQIAASGSPDYLAAAVLLAFLSGAFLLAMGLLRLGIVANFLSHPVITGFVTASGLLIAASQLRHILGVKGGGQTLPEIAENLWPNLAAVNPSTILLGLAAIAALVAARRWLKGLLIGLGLTAGTAGILARLGPMVVVIASILLTVLMNLPASGVAILGEVPRGLPTPALPRLDPDLIARLALPALLISIVGYVETISVAQTLAAKRRQRIDPDQELVALGASNLGAALSGGFPVTGGFARSVVNFDAGAETPAAGAITALFMALATLFLTPALYNLPQAVLAATIIVAVLSLVDLGAFGRTWAYSRADAAAMGATVLVTLVKGVEMGIVAGIGLSLALYLLRTSRPHMAVVGQVAGTEHFRNVLRHHVVTVPNILSIRVDESLYFANTRALEDRILAEVADRPALKHVVLMCPAVNDVDASALESLEAINHRLKDAGVLFHLTEVKGPVMDRLNRSHFLRDLSGQVFLSQIDAMRTLAPDETCAALACQRSDSLRKAV
ncbi:sulfate permease [Frigidibacter sp. RF13]|uniref:SulP family inorganic anion transporter n=1 Tax=Frigidibacter sp. RF13 TaxID=2997340 RepID=UPI002270B052|nr:sulfate permease [Frigidibacter sp. RF13]MCY1125650.1 sulfate permease [Frigidibacter sp. RF13]